MAGALARWGAVSILVILLSAALSASAGTMKSREDLVGNENFIESHDKAMPAQAADGYTDTTTTEPMPEAPVKMSKPKPTPVPDFYRRPAPSTSSPSLNPDDPLGESRSGPGIRQTDGSGTTDTPTVSEPVQVAESDITTPAPAPTGAAAAAPACRASKLAGYTSAVRLKYGYLLHWAVVSPTLINFALEAKVGSGARLGWVAVGFSKDGAMTPADAIIANQPDTVVGAYNVNGYDAGSIVPAPGISLGDASLIMATNSSLIVKFQRKTTDGQVPISTSGKTNVIWAYSASATQALAFHEKKRGSLVVDFSCNGGGAAAGGALPIEGGVPVGPTVPAGSKVEVGSFCPASTLMGYEHMADLYDSKVLLHWKVLPGPVFRMAVEAKKGSGAETGWIAVGWSNNGAMAPSDAVVGNLPDVKAFTLGGYKLTDLKAGGFGLGKSFGTSYSNMGSTVIRFVRFNGDGGTVPINLNGETQTIWAFSRNTFSTFGYHDTNRGLAAIDYLCNTAPAILMKPGSRVPFIAGEDVDEDDLDKSPAERQADEERRERRRSRRAERGSAFRSWMDAAVGVPSTVPAAASVPASTTPSAGSIFRLLFP